MSCKRFQQSCPRKLKKYPCQACPNALVKLGIIKDDSISPCEWYINDESSSYCFWFYNSKEQNKHKHTLDKIAKLTKTSINNIKLAETIGKNRFIKKLRIRNPAFLQEVIEAYNHKNIK